MAGYSVCLIEQNETGSQRAQTRIETLIDGAVSRGKLQPSSLPAFRDRLVFATDYDALKGADLVIEAVFEDMAVKQGVFAALADVLSDDAIVATNTSYLNPEQMMAMMPNPSRSVGLHFFSPAHIMKLLEIIKLSTTSADVMATAFAFAKSLANCGTRRCV